jgi:hypothetical protein
MVVDVGNSSQHQVILSKPSELNSYNSILPIRSMLGYIRSSEYNHAPAANQTQAAPSDEGTNVMIWVSEENTLRPI